MGSKQQLKFSGHLERETEKKKGDRYAVLMSESNAKIDVEAPQRLLEASLNFPNRDASVTKLTVTRQRCLNPSMIDSFLRLMRHGSDDIVRQRINQYTRREATEVPSKRERCSEFVQNELYPNWAERMKVLTFCNEQANQLKAELDLKYGGEDNDNASRDEAARAAAVRLDPYAERDRREEQEAHYAEWRRLKQWVDNNLEVESILRGTTDKVLKQNCDNNEEYLEAFFEQLNRRN